MQQSLNQQCKEDFKLFFNEVEHKYMDSYGKLYTSMTTIIGKYEVKFSDKQNDIARACSRKRDSQYYGWSVQRILDYWEKGKNEACAKGTLTHNKLETAVKTATGFRDYKGGNETRRELYTVQDIMNGTKYGELHPDKFLTTTIKEEFPRIYNLFITLADKGYKFYAEIGVFNEELLISGLIDILCINFESRSFIIVDWKTNKENLIPFGNEMYKDYSGYFTKDKQGIPTQEFKFTNTYFLNPLGEYQQSKFNIYTFQLSGYAALVESFGFTNKGMFLFQIREDLLFDDPYENVIIQFPHLLGMKRTDLYQVPNRSAEMIKCFKHHKYSKEGQQVNLVLR